ncbi:MAG TPA: hypothetical protein VLJ37_06460 [bacterium]|nr:hypothetical protein [bacterium]
MRKWIFPTVLLLLALWSADVRSESATVTGEVLDTFCFAAMGAKGESHRPCGLECAKKGIPVGLLEEKTNQVYVLLPAKDRGTLPPELIDKMGRKATVTGKIYKNGGSQFLTVDSVQ